MRLRRTTYGADVVGGMREEEEERKKKIEKVVEGVFIFARASPISDLRQATGTNIETSAPAPSRSIKRVYVCTRPRYSEECNESVMAWMFSCICIMKQCFSE